MFGWIYRNVVRAFTVQLIKQVDVGVGNGSATLSLRLRHDARNKEDYLQLVCTGNGEHHSYDMNAHEFRRFVAATLEMASVMKDRGLGNSPDDAPEPDEV